MAAECLIAVRVPPEGRDHLPHVVGLRHQRQVYRLQFCRRLRGDVLAEPDEKIQTLQVILALAVAQRQAEDDLEPRAGESGVVAVCQALHDQRQRGAILREGSGLAPPERTRKLVEHDDERQPAFGIAGPVIEIALGPSAVRSENRAMISVSAPPRIRQNQCSR